MDSVIVANQASEDFIFYHPLGFERFSGIPTSAICVLQILQGVLSSWEISQNSSKKLKLAVKKHAQERKNAAAAAVKLMPSLKAVQAKLTAKMDEVQSTGTSLPEASEEQVQAAVKQVNAAVECGGCLMDRCAKGKSLDDMSLAFSSEKDLNSLMRSANAAARVIAESARSQRKCRPKNERARQRQSCEKDRCVSCAACSLPA